MSPAVGGALAAGGIAGAAVGYIVGEARTRARRAWRDFRQLRTTVTGSLKVAATETWRAVRVLALIGLVLAAVIVITIMALRR